jgi:hypothetical protein
MKTWIFILLLSVLSLNKAGATEASVIGGKIVFHGYCSSCAVTAPELWEINLSTTLFVLDAEGKTIMRWKNYSEWLECQTQKGLKKKIMEIRGKIDSMSDFSASDSRDLKERIGWLKSYYQSLE